MTLVPEGELCYCGKRGCVDPYCSASLLSNSTDGSLERFFQLLRELVALHNTFEQDGSYLHICQYRLEATAVDAALQYIEEFLRSV
jgi:predicted NBD/HSP70 family sugar kinase